jgi:CubicO group peptidase (beta-lactamase class C family)
MARWDGLVRDVVPEFELADAQANRHCTFRDLAALRVGLGRDGIAEWGMRQDLPKPVRLARARHMATVAPFRERFSYSNLCYIALSLAAERLAGQPYPSLVQERVCEPLGLLDSYSAGFGVAPGANAALPHMPQAGAPPVAMRDLTGANSEGSARMHLSVRDAALWLRFLLDALGGSDAGPLPAAAVRAMAAPHATVPDPDIRMAPEQGAACAYGMGMFVTTWHGHTLLRHGGGGRGWRHAMALAPDVHAGVMVMAAAESPAIDGLALQLLEALTDEAPRNWSASFAHAAELAAAAERRAIETRFAVATGAARVLPAPGIYANPVTGKVRIELDGPQLRFLPEDAPDFAATLQPLGGDVCALDFDEPALAPQPLDPPFRLRGAGGAATPALETSYFGVLGAVA